MPSSRSIPVLRSLTVGMAALLIAACGPTGPDRGLTANATLVPAAASPPVPSSTPELARTGATALPSLIDPPLRVLSRDDALPPGFVPDDLVTLPAALSAPGYGGLRLTRPAAEALALLVQDAAAAGHTLRAVSAYRSFEEQALIHQRAVERSGIERAQRVSARPGHSEHQLGTTVDISAPSVAWRLTSALAGTAEGAWLAAHAHEYGFALSYPAGAEDVTGYIFEPWHYRYIGRDHAARWRASGFPLITYLRSLGG